MGVNTLVALNSQGLFFSVHASEVLRILREYGIEYAWVQRPCVATSATGDAIMMIPLVIGMSAALAVAVLVFALKSGANLGGLSQYVSRLSGRAPSPWRRDDRNREPPATPRSARQQVDWAKSGGNFTLQSMTGGNSFAIEGGRVLVVGRGHKAQIVIDGDTVSSMHARLQLSSAGDRLTISDLGSSNGTYLNASRITTTQAQLGDVIRFGTAEFKLMSGGSSLSADAGPRRLGCPRPRLDAVGLRPGRPRRAVRVETHGRERERRRGDDQLGVRPRPQPRAVRHPRQQRLRRPRRDHLRAEPGLTLRDLSSTNGTRVDGEVLGNARTSSTRWARRSASEPPSRGFRAWCENRLRGRAFRAGRPYGKTACVETRLLWSLRA
jgi:pSer/pThr/pTyr-binding forkhead associated (FHA) protein